MSGKPNILNLVDSAFAGGTSASEGKDKATGRLDEKTEHEHRSEHEKQEIKNPKKTFAKADYGYGKKSGKDQKSKPLEQKKPEPGKATQTGETKTKADPPKKPKKP